MNTRIRQVTASALRLLFAQTDAALRRDLAAALALTLSLATLSAIAPMLFKSAVDAFDARSAGGASLQPIWLMVAYLAAVCLLRLSADFRVHLSGVAEKGVQRRITARAVRHVLSLPTSTLSDSASGSIAQVINNGLTGYQSLLHHALFTVVPMCLELLVVACVLFSLQHTTYLGIICLGAAAQIVIYAYGARRIVPPARDAASAAERSNAALTDALLNAEVIKYSNAQYAVANQHDALVGIAEREWHRFFRQRRATSLLTTAVFCVSLVASLLLAAREVLQLRMSIGDLILIQLYLVRFTQPLELLGQAIRDMSQAVVTIDRLMGLLAMTPERSASSAARPVLGEIRLVDITFSYQPNRRALTRVSHTIDAGSTVALVGASGSGKSTLTKLLVNLYQPDSGQIQLDQLPLEQWPLQDLRAAIALVPQDTILFNDTLRYNITLGQPGRTALELQQATFAACLDEFIARLPDGLNTRVGERGLKLSAGERQRIAIARALLRHPRVYIFDEATSSLDSKLERQILERLRAATAGCTVLIVAHRLASITHADEIVVFEHGRIIERGTHQQLLSYESAYAQLWGAQAKAPIAG